MIGYAKVVEDTPKLATRRRPTSLKRSSSLSHPLAEETQNHPLFDCTAKSSCPMESTRTLSRTHSSGAHSHRPLLDKRRGGKVPGSLRKAFSTKKMASVADAYRRIRDTDDARNKDHHVGSVEDDDDDDVGSGGDCDHDGRLQAAQGRRGGNKKKGKVARAWKRIFGTKPKKAAGAGE